MPVRISSLWFSGPVRNLDLVCMASWVGLGFEVDLYSFDAPPALPRGVRLRDAGEVLSRDYVERLVPLHRKDRRRWQPVANYSDLFRVALMRQGRGLWLDTDVLLFRHFEPDPARPFFAWEDRVRIGSPVFYVPQGHAMLEDYARLFDSPELMPHWLGFRRRVLRQAVWRMLGVRYSPPDLGITIYGNDAFSRLAKKHGIAREALPRRSFYPWHADETLRFFDPAHGGDLWEDPHVLGLHVHRKPYPNRRPAPGSMFARAAERYAPLLPGMVWEEG